MIEVRMLNFCLIFNNKLKEYIKKQKFKHDLLWNILAYIEKEKHLILKKKEN